MLFSDAADRDDVGWRGRSRMESVSIKFKGRSVNPSRDPTIPLMHELYGYGYNSMLLSVLNLQSQHSFFLL